MRWTLKPEPSHKTIAILSKSLNIPNVLAKLLVQRGVSNYNEAKQFFRPNLEQLHDPFLMKGMEKAVQRINKAIKNKEHILIYGDYDVDGTTAVALVSKYLKQYSQNIATYIPDRETEGYGISYKGIDFADDNECYLIIALDCGIKAIEQVAYANTKNIDFIICDHHTPCDTLPQALAILNPKQKDCPYPYKELCGCGVGFKLIQALNSQQGQSIRNIIPFLDLVVTSIAADIVPITGENRTLAYLGLKVLNSTPSCGLKSIIEGQQKETLDISDIVFYIAPRINAMGRLQHANKIIQLLVENDYSNAKTLCQQIELTNKNRKDLDKNITQEALQQIDHELGNYKYSTVVFNPNWHKGVVGIVASRLIETHYRPTIVLTQTDSDLLVGSARSVKGFDLYEALNSCGNIIKQFGGHKSAAGLKININDLDLFRNTFEEVVKQQIDPKHLEPEIVIDSELFLSEITPKLYRIIEQMAPFGPGNMRPIFTSNNLTDNGYSRTVGIDNRHLKLNILESTDPKTYNGIGFNMGHKLSITKQPFQIAYNLQENNWKNTKTIQLNIRDLKPY